MRRTTTRRSVVALSLSEVHNVEARTFRALGLALIDVLENLLEDFQERLVLIGKRRLTLEGFQPGDNLFCASSGVPATTLMDESPS